MRVTKDEIDKIVLQVLPAAFKMSPFPTLKDGARGEAELRAAIGAITNHVSESLKLTPRQASRLFIEVQRSFSDDSFTIGQTRYALTGENLALLIFFSLDTSDEIRAGGDILRLPQAPDAAPPTTAPPQRHDTHGTILHHLDKLESLWKSRPQQDVWRPSTSASPPTEEPPLVGAEPEPANQRRGQGSVPRIVKTEYLVWYGTNRRIIKSDGVPIGYSAERDSKMHYGMCRVYIPKAHKIGSLGSPWWKRLFTRTDDRLRLMTIKQLRQESFWEQIRSQLSKLSLDERCAVIFVHGYNVSFKDAALRAAQIGFDLSIKGAMAFFSWPSQGTIGGYMADAATIEASEQDITNFMIDFVTKSGAESVHIIAHSMGNRGVLRAVNRIAVQAEQRSGVPFGQIVLAAADVDSDTFRQLCGAYAQIARRTTLYISERDRAVEASHWLHQSQSGAYASYMHCQRD